MARFGDKRQQPIVAVRMKPAEWWLVGGTYDLRDRLEDAGTSFDYDDWCHVYHGEELPDSIRKYCQRFAVEEGVATQTVEKLLAAIKANGDGIEIGEPVESEVEQEPVPLPARVYEGLPEWYDIPTWFDDLIYAIQRGDPAIALVGPTGNGKAQPLDSLVMTPSGPVRMGDIQLGDMVCTPNGTAPVVGVYPQGEVDIYRITFADGSSVESCGEHLWKVGNITHWPKPKVITTKEMLGHVHAPNGRRLLSISVPGPLDMEEQPVFIPPYLMGYMIANGYFGKSGIRLSIPDEETVLKIREMLHSGYDLVYAGGIDYRISTKMSGNVYIQTIRTLGLDGHRSWEKFIPNTYLYNSIENRLELLRGLMDGDGDVWRGLSHYSTSSEQLAQQVQWLIESFGGICTINEKYPVYTHNGEHRNGRKAYVLQVRHADCRPFFSLSRKQNAVRVYTKYFPKRIIDSIECIGKKEAQCIAVGSSEHLYLTDHCVVTHNTASARMALRYLQVPYDELDCTEVIEPYHIVGRNSFRIEGKKGEEVFVPGKLTNAFMNGWGFIGNEFDALNPRAALVFQSPFQDAGVDGDERYITIPETNERIYPRGACPIILTMNTFGTGATRMYVGRNAIDAATLDRVTFIYTGYEREAERLLKRGFGKKDVTKLMKWAEKIRSHIDANGLRVTLSPRTLLRMSQRMNDGQSLELAAEKEFFAKYVEQREYLA